MNTLKIITAAILFFLLFSVSVLFVNSSQQIDAIEYLQENQKGMLEIIKMQGKEIDLLIQIEIIHHGCATKPICDSSIIDHGYLLDSAIISEAPNVDTFKYDIRPRNRKR